MRLILASSSPIRSALLTRAGVPHEVQPARIDEEALRASLAAEGAGPRDLADALAEAKARKLAQREPEAMVLGCDQILEAGGQILGKPGSLEEARDQLGALRGNEHRLFSAVVVHEGGRPVWRQVGVARMTMRSFSDAYLDDYLDRNWEAVRDGVGAYRIEEEGIRLFAGIDGDYFTVLGLPLVELLGYLTLRGVIDG